jgi:flagellar biosynthetic protein FliP
MAAGEMSIQLNAPFPDDGRVEFKANRNSGQAAKGSEHDRKHDSETWPNGRKVDENQLFELLGSQCEQLFSRQGSSSSIKMVLLLGALSLAPAMLLMTTCYIRMIVVLMLMRQAFGGQQLPPNQVLTALALFLTVWVMAPVWNEVKSTAIDPYTQSQSISWEEAWSRGVEPIKRFMARQIELTQNTRSIALFYRQTRGSYSAEMPASIDEVPLSVMLPAFLVSELKVAFLLGFQILLPFLVLDFVVSTVTVSMGMLMLPPTMVSFPLKLILFVMVDGWNLVVGMLLQSLGPIG